MRRGTAEGREGKGEGMKKKRMEAPLAARGMLFPGPAVNKRECGASDARYRLASAPRGCVA